MIQPKSETEDLFLLISTNCETINKQTHREPEETLESRLSQPRETFHFNPLISTISIEGSLMIGLTSVELYIFIFNITDENNNFEFYTETFVEIVLKS